MIIEIKKIFRIFKKFLEFLYFHSNHSLKKLNIKFLFAQSTFLSKEINILLRREFTQ